MSVEMFGTDVLFKWDISYQFIKYHSCCDLVH